MAGLLTGGGGGVPIIVQKCVEEVERRGMDIVGLYRLCGSATKKRILREAFERNPRLVDLSPDSVPDINVITGNWIRNRLTRLTIALILDDECCRIIERVSERTAGAPFD